MEFGRFDILQLSEGLFRLTDNLMEEFTGEPSALPVAEPKTPGRLLVSINVVLIRGNDTIILCDTGIGTKLKDQACDYPAPAGKTKSIREQLASLGIRTQDVTHVLLTHLHYDHAGGVTCYDRAGNLMLTYPNAAVFIQVDEWDAAQQSLYRKQRGYLSENWGVLSEAQNLQLVTGTEEVVPGVKLIKTNGHTRGHQIITIDSGDDRKAAVFGDLIPTPSHFNRGLKLKFDFNGEQSKLMRRKFIDTALQEDWLLFFYHAPHVKAGKGVAVSQTGVKVKKYEDSTLRPYFL